MTLRPEDVVSAGLSLRQQETLITLGHSDIGGVSANERTVLRTAANQKRGGREEISGVRLKNGDLCQGLTW